MIGDRPDTDMLLGYNAEIDRCITLTGVVSDIYSISGWIEKS